VGKKIMDKKIMIMTIIMIGIIISGVGCVESEERIIIGGKTFNEQYILPEMIALLLEDAGYSTEVKTGLNSQPLYEGMKDGDIDIYVEYTGTAYSELLGLPLLEVWNPEIVYNNVVTWLGYDNINVLYKLGFEDAYSIAVEENWAIENNVTTISDLVTYAPNMVFGSDLVFHERPDGLLNLNEIYNISFKEIKSMEPTLMYDAIKNGEVDAIPPYTTDTRVDSYNLRVLIDDKAALPPYEAILLITDELSQDQKIVDALTLLEGAVTAEEMRAMNAEWDIEKRNEKDVAKEFLIEEGLITK
jgi:osmoprotectant transport system substrate-binding protein